MTVLVRDIDPAECWSGDYDVAILASGYEQRCTHVARKLGTTPARDVLVLGFDSLRQTQQRACNDRYFERKWPDSQMLLSGSDDGPVYQWLSDRVPVPRDGLRMLVDYSSMSRLWYAALLNWARYASGSGTIALDMVYSVGAYDSRYTPIVIDEMLLVPGFEGGAFRLNEAVAVFGLGVYGVMAQCVLDHIEPDRVYAFYADPGANRNYARHVCRDNAAILERARAALPVPLAPVSEVAYTLASMVLPELRTSEVLLIPMGPKPHVLAALVVALWHKEVGCLRVSAIRAEPEQVRAKGPIVATRLLVDRSDDQAGAPAEAGSSPA